MKNFVITVLLVLLRVIGIVLLLLCGGVLLLFTPLIWVQHWVERNIMLGVR